MIKVDNSTYNVKYKILIHKEYCTFVIDNIPEALKKDLTTLSLSDRVVQLEYDECSFPVLISYFGSNKFYAKSFE